MRFPARPTAERSLAQWIARAKAIKRFVIPDWCILPLESGVGDPSSQPTSSAGEKFQNWGGEEAAGNKTNHYKAIEAVWREANSSTTCSDPEQAHATWVGLGGDANYEQNGPNLIQDGSLQTESSHYTWWEISMRRATLILLQRQP